ncbi:AI-2E family transporter [Novosphingobium sp. KCTC 2891]|uniref:AI-2E family transporter n=1 Tax=Novosphingobium sp. KCTC 2891 TaxID=2989730 RepID=UPI00222327D9|nr:AI-2E family transporter [Novosphingobium sp. KCTC 2891]MCW1381957.1 AI-2E family transporter [Novosphingobium sp. KCTC 2891]
MDPELTAPVTPAGEEPPVDQSARLQSAILLLLGLGLFLALPFVLSIGSVVFLPPVTAMIFTIVLSPLADRLIRFGLPNMLASFLAITAMIAVIVLALSLILQPAFVMVDQVPTLVRQVSQRFAELRGNLAWIGDINRQLARLTGHTAREVVLASPSVIEQVAFATPSVVLETLLTFLMTFFMIESRIRMKRRLLLDRQSFGASVRIARVLRDVQDRVASYILTVAQINFGVGVIVAAGAWAYGLAAPIMWGGLAFVLNFLPYLGPLVLMGLLALIGLGTASTVALGLVPMLAFLALHAIESNVITPSILGARFTLNPVSILLAISYFSWIWGVLGALLSVPILLTLSALLEHLGRPNMVGFLFGEPLFEPPSALLSEADAAAQAASEGSSAARAG